MSAIAHGYQRWTGVSTDIWTRRLAITRYGLRLCWQSRLLKILFAISWVNALVLTTFYFLIGQALTPHSALIEFIAESFGKRVEAVVNGLSAWLLLYPEVTVDGLYRSTFSLMTALYSILSFFAVSLFVPKLISHDLSSRAILIYNSKALTRFDYVLGKFGIVAGIIGGLFLAPLTFSWFLGNLFSPDWSFFVHSFSALLRAWTIGGTTVVAVSLLALGVSSLAKKTSTATALWIVLWITPGVIASGASQVAPWAKYISLRACLSEIAQHCFRIDEVLTRARETLPFFSSAFGNSSVRTPFWAQAPTDSVGIAVAFLFGYCAIAVIAISKRVRAE